jgi:hypothetical protein
LRIRNQVADWLTVLDEHQTHNGYNIKLKEIKIILYRFLQTLSLDEVLPMKTDREKLEERLKYLQELLLMFPVRKTFKIHAEIVAIKEQLSSGVMGK